MHSVRPLCRHPHKSSVSPPTALQRVGGSSSSSSSSRHLCRLSAHERAPAVSGNRWPVVSSRRRWLGTCACAKPDSEELQEDVPADIAKDLQKYRSRKPEAPDASNSLSPVSSIKDGVDKLLVGNFFLVLLLLSWLVAGLVQKAASTDTGILDAWLSWWPGFTQPAIGILMAATLASGVLSWAQQRD